MAILYQVLKESSSIQVQQSRAECDNFHLAFNYTRYKKLLLLVLSMEVLRSILQPVIGRVGQPPLLSSGWILDWRHRWGRTAFWSVFHDRFYSFIVFWCEIKHCIWGYSQEYLRTNKALPGPPCREFPCKCPLCLLGRQQGQLPQHLAPWGNLGNNFIFREGCSAGNPWNPPSDAKSLWLATTPNVRQILRIAQISQLILTTAYKASVAPMDKWENQGSEILRTCLKSNS